MALHEPITETLKHIHFISHHLSSPLLRLMRAREKWRRAVWGAGGLSPTTEVRNWNNLGLLPSLISGLQSTSQTLETWRLQQQTAVKIWNKCELNLFNLHKQQC